MSYIRTFENYINENTFKKGEVLKHNTYDNILGTVEYGPSTFIDIKSRGYYLEDESDFTEDEKLKVWYGLVLKDGTKLGIHKEEFKKSK